MLREDNARVVLKIHVKPRARRTAIAGVRHDAVLVEVTAPPERNKANDAVIALLADALGIAKSRIEILSGQGYKEKLVCIYGLTEKELMALIEPARSARRGRS